MPQLGPGRWVPLHLSPLNKWALEDIRLENNRGVPHEKIKFDWRITQGELDAILWGEVVDGLRGHVKKFNQFLIIS